MPVLINEDRVDVWANAMRHTAIGEIGITKQELRAAVDAMDAWLENNAASANTALPQPARGSLTAPQKALLLSMVIAKRYLRT